MRIRHPVDTLRRSLSALVAAVLLWAPSVAWACATCMNDPVRKKTVPILMGFIGVPFLVAGGIALALRQYLKK